MIEKIKYKKKLLALIVRTKRNKKSGVNFVSPNNFTLQDGLMKHPKSHTIKPHIHKKHLRKIKTTSEVLFINKGSLRVDFYTNQKKYLFSKLLKENDLIILNEGSHGFKVEKKCEMIEIKQGPFNKLQDKIRFNKIDENKIKIKK